MLGLCPMCQKDLAVGDAVKLRDKGASSINDAARLRNDSIIVSSQQVHVKCRKRLYKFKIVGLHWNPYSKNKRETL